MEDETFTIKDSIFLIVEDLKKNFENNTNNDSNSNANSEYVCDKDDIITTYNLIEENNVENLSYSFLDPKEKSFVNKHYQFTKDTKELDLAQNGLTGVIEPLLTIFRNVVHINLSFNKLESPLDGNIWNHLRSLSYLDLSHNLFYGQINDSFFFSLPNIEFLNLSYNKLKSTIPSTIGTMKKIKMIMVAHNEIYGPLPKEFFDLTSIELVNIDNIDIKNDREELIHGNLFPGLEKLTRLKVLSIENHALEMRNENGTIHHDFIIYDSINFAPLILLSNLILKGNDLCGPVPHSLFDIPFLVYLDLSRNQFDSIKEISHPNLKTLDLSYNILPSFLVGKNNMPSLLILNLSFNLISSFFIDENSTPSLIVLNLSNNRIKNGICSLNHILNIQDLNISHNKFKELDFNIVKMKMFDKLKYFSISHNKFQGSSPIPKSKVLVTFDISNNCFHSLDLKKLIENCPNVKHIYANNNKISNTMFPIYSKVFDLGNKKLKVLKLDHNRIKGKIDKSISKFENLKHFSISNNKIISQIPNELLDMKKLKILDLSNNGFYGPFPKFREFLKKFVMFNVVDNHYSIAKYITFEELSQSKNKSAKMNQI